MTTIGYATLQIIPSLDGVSAAVQRSLGSVLPGIGRAAGRSLGEDLAAGVDQAKTKVEAASAKIVAANKKVEDQAGKVRVAEQQLQALRDRGVTDAGRLAAAEEKVASAQRNHTAALGQQENATRDLQVARQRLATARAESANAAQNEGEQTRRFAGAVDTVGQKAGGAIGNLKNLAVAAAGIGSAMEIASAAMDMQGATAKMNASLGATGPLAEEYGKTAASLYGKGFGASMEDVTKAVESVATTFPTLGAEGEVAMDKAAGRALNLAKVFDIDVAEASQTASQLITNGLAKDSTQAMDMLTAALQRVPAAMRGELPEVLNEYGKHFQTFGLSGQAAMGLIVDMAPQGKIALDKTGDAIKELSIRATDGSKSTTAAFEAIKVDGDAMAKAIASGGPQSQAAMQEIAKGLLSIQDPADRAQAAIALFGTPLEDLGVDKVPQFLTALSGSSKSMTDTAGAADQLGETLNDTAQSKLTALSRGIQTGLVEGLGSAIGFIQENKQLLGDLGIAAGVAGGALLIMAGPAVLTAIKTMVTSTRVWTAGQWLLNAALSANPIGIVVTAIAALVAGIVIAYRNSETFRDIVAGAWNWIKDAASAVVSWFTDTAWPFLQGAIDNIGEKWQWLVSVAQAVWDGVRDKFNGMVTFVTSLPEKIKAAATGMWDGIRDAFKGAINWIIRAWNSIEFKIPGFKVGPVGYDGFTLGVPDIPEFAQGGWTGPGGKYDIAGIVHADEFVLSKRARAAIEGTNPGLLDFMNATGQVPGYADGGKVESYGLPANANSGGYGGKGVEFPEWLLALGRQFNVKPSTYENHQTGEGSGGAAYGYAPNPQGLNRGVDWSGTVADMQRFADHLMTIAPSQTGLEQVIWWNPETGQKAGWAGRRNVTSDSYYDYPQGYPDHRDHVHTRFASAVGADAGTTTTTTDTGAGASPISAAASTTSTAVADYTGLTGDALKTKYDEDTAAAKAEYDTALDALKAKYGIGGGSSALSDRARDLAKRKRDLAAQYRNDKDAAKGDKDKLKQLADAYTAASNALKDEGDQLADDKDTASSKKTGDKAAYDAAKDELDAKFKAATDARKKAYEAAKGDGKGTGTGTGSGSGSYPTTISGWAGFIGEHFVGGQIKSLLSVFGIPDNPSWMQGLGQLVGGIKVSDKNGKSLFDGSNPLAALTGAADGKTTTPATAASSTGTDSKTVMPGGALPLTGQQATPAQPATETLTSTLSAPPAKYKGGSQPIYDAVYKEFRAAGFTDAMWPDFVNIENNEAAWDPEARNPSSDAYGFAQFLGKGNVDKYLGGQNRNVPVDVQARGMMQYLKDRYENPTKAWEFWQKNGWYAEGGHTGPGGKYDIAGIVHADEFVLSKWARGSIERKAPGLLDRMNATGQVPGYAEGGRVGFSLDWTDIARRGMDVAMATVQGQTGKKLPAGGQVVYNIAARDTEDAFIRAQRQEKERAAAKLSRF
ncbi:aggregation-promoting factor C-terminal-like domain-containing protein [Tsukamurella ocularis]|uniref:aggregation-promoting factor C-terminal-like domain-containing protein n=1 Tax=Tsukamurella ocularis TaxID=1970234 RepID=UPI0039EF98CC